MDIATTEKRTGLYWIGLSLAVILLDQVTKYLITSYFIYNEAVYLAPFLNITLEFNKGAAFSFLSGAGYLALLLFIALAVIISSVLCVWLSRLPPRSYWLAVSLSLILGGAIGNLLDRIIYGYVIDFIHLHIDGWSWPIFNVADIAITTGALMLIVDIFKKRSA